MGKNFSFFHIVYSSVEIAEFTATIFSQKFSESNFLLTNFSLNLFDEKKLHGRHFLVFPHCVLSIVEQKFREI